MNSTELCVPWTMVAALIFAGAVLIIGSLLPDHLLTPWWVSSHPQIQAEGNVCYTAARHYRNNFNYEPPPRCWNSSWFKGSDGHWARPLPSDQQQGERPPPDAPPPPDAVP